MVTAGFLVPGQAIPTLYRGITFRSRLEADMAFLLDGLRLSWTYEPSSVLLDTGDHFAIDFFVASRRLWVETRGVHSPKGDRQIGAFARRCQESEDEDFLVVGPDTIVLHEPVARWGVPSGPARLLRCGTCRSFSFIGAGWEACRAVDCPGGYGGPDLKLDLAYRAGRLFVDGLPMPDWIRTL